VRLLCLVDLFKFREIHATRWLLWHSDFTKFDLRRGYQWPTSIKPTFFNTKCPFCCIPLPIYPGNRQMLAKPSSNLLQKPGWRTFMMTRLCWILGYRRQEIWCEIGLSRNGCHCTALCTRSGACYYWIGQALNNAGLITGVLIATQRSVTIKR